MTTSSLSASVAQIEHRTTAGGNSRLDSVQALRGIASALVVLHHFAYMTMEHSKRPSWIISSGLVYMGAAGVDLFFVISGFIMVYTTRNKAGVSDALTFLKKRVIRIYPLYWLWLTLLVILWKVGIAQTTHTYTGAYILLSYALLATSPLLAYGWSLVYEMFFYLTFSCSLLLKLNKTKLVFLTAIFVTLFLLGKYGALGDGNLQSFFHRPIIFEFLLGALAAELLAKFSVRTASMPFIFAAAGVLLFLSTRGNAYHDESVRCLEWGIPSFLVLLAAATYQSKVHRGLVYLGNASYTIYLAHAFFVSAYDSLIKRTNLLQNIPNDLTILVCTTLTIAITASFYPYTELRIQKWLASNSSQAPLMPSSSAR